ncbi:hypothetical protein MJT46_015745 [Ovis ammon polii x Ovis aries]|nr:hypothetical protein MJT46_015745 [Ovis ammon polii x Ovis aries]
MGRAPGGTARSFGGSCHEPPVAVAGAVWTHPEKSSDRKAVARHPQRNRRPEYGTVTSRIQERKGACARKNGDGDVEMQKMWTQVPSLVWEESTCGLSLCPPLLKPLGPGDYAPEEEKPPPGSPHTPPREGPLLATARDGNEDPVPHEINTDIHFTTK